MVHIESACTCLVHIGSACKFSWRMTDLVYMYELTVSYNDSAYIQQHL